MKVYKKSTSFVYIYLILKEIQAFEGKFTANRPPSFSGFDINKFQEQKTFQLRDISKTFECANLEDVYTNVGIF